MLHRKMVLMDHKSSPKNSRHRLISKTHEIESQTISKRSSLAKKAPIARQKVALTKCYEFWIFTYIKVQKVDRRIDECALATTDSTRNRPHAALHDSP